jgi:putative tributyrin esterase
VKGRAGGLAGSVFPLLLGCGLVLLVSCRQSEQPAPADHPRLPAGVVLQDVKFHSVALQRDMPYRVVMPARAISGAKLPVVYLLHGGGGGFHDWSNYSDAARLAERGLILVMPEGESSYYTNSATRPRDRYEDYIVHDLIADVESKFPAAPARGARAIVGVSMGGFGAITLALKHPDLYAFAAGISPAIDVPSRPFSIKRVGQWRQHSAIFGAWGSQTRHDNDPYTLARSAIPGQIPYIYLSCGDKEGLLPANRKFAALLDDRHIVHEFHVARGGHDWNQWNAQLPSVWAAMERRVRTGSL